MTSARRRSASAPLEPASTSSRCELRVEQQVHDLLADRVPELLEHRVALGAVLDERVLLRHRAQVDALAQVVHVLEVLAPARVDDLQDHVALELAHAGLAVLGGAELLLLRRVDLAGVVGELLDQRLARASSSSRARRG